MSLCDRCFAPGACCKDLVLWTKGEPSEALTTWRGEALEQMAKYRLPFQPAGVHSSHIVDDPDSPEHGREYVVYRWKCPHVTTAGRCGIYDRRPQLCRDFDAGSDALCVHFGGAEAGDPTLTEAA